MFGKRFATHPGSEHVNANIEPQLTNYASETQGNSTEGKNAHRRQLQRLRSHIMSRAHIFSVN